MTSATLSASVRTALAHALGAALGSADKDAAVGTTAAPPPAAPSAPSAARAAVPAPVQGSARRRAATQGAQIQAALHAHVPQPQTASPERAAYEAKLAAYEKAHDAWQKKTDDYWTAMKAARKAGHYITEQPPGKYDGPPKPHAPPPTEAPQIVVAPPPSPPPTPPAHPRSSIPKKQDFIDAAKKVYGFTPEQADEATFKKRYAAEAKKAGLTADEVARVYAFETGGKGKYDDQPIRKDGTAISTALGYAQVMNATSIDMVARHGAAWATALDNAGKHGKADAVRRMAADAKAVGDDWNKQRAYAKTPQGRAMHALNLDVDVGPKMQMEMLKEIKKTGERLGVKDPTAAQLELMNLAGERNGAHMITPETTNLPTANFFTRAGYEANPVTHNRTGAQLLGEIDKDMDFYVKKPGTQQFYAAFRALGR